MIPFLIALAVLVVGFFVHLSVTQDRKGTVVELARAAMWVGLFVALTMVAGAFALG